MRLIKVFALVLITLCGPSLFAQSSSHNIRALLVLASNGQGGADDRLSSYEPTLKRILRFDTYRLLGDGSTQLEAPGSGTLGLGQGHSLALDAEKSEGKGVKIRVRWQQGGKTHLSTGLSLRPGVPAVLGGPSSGKDGVFAVILIAD